MPTRQAEWRMIANLGDASPFDYGGYFIFKDKMGTHAEAHLLAVDDEEDENSTYTIYRIVLERFQLVDGHLVPLGNPRDWMPHYKLEDHAVWFQERLADVAPSVEATKEDLERSFTSANPIERAHAYRAVAEYLGWHEFDHNPMRGLSRTQVELLYLPGLEQLKESKGPKKWSPRG